MKEGLISIIIPCYNAEHFIEETVNSILVQQGVAFEIIIVDDGSTDGSASVIQALQKQGVTYIHQGNKGVSAARNRGLRQAKGEYVLFFDADDKMSEDFLFKRKKVLREDVNAGFSCGPVHTFPVESNETYGITEAIAKGLLTYNPEYCSCPSNYLIRTSVLLNNQLFFNEELSSTADRFFLIELETRTTGRLIKDAPLLYRVSPNSMSNKVTKKLIDDNELYYIKLKENNLIPKEIRKRFEFKIQYILGLGFLRTGSYQKGIKYTFNAFFESPKLFVSEIKLRFSDR